MSRYKCTKLKNLSPLHGFLIYTPDYRTLKDLHPQFIVRELNRLNERIKRLEEAGNMLQAAVVGVEGMTHWQWLASAHEADLNWRKAKEATP